MTFWLGLHFRLGTSYVFRDFHVNSSIYEGKCNNKNLENKIQYIFFS